MKRIISIVVAVGLVAAMAIAADVLRSGAARASDCAPLARDYGTQQISLSVPVDATYRLWSRMQASGVSNSYRLVVDGGTCFAPGGADVSGTVWTWVGHEAADAAATTDVYLAAGSHQLMLIGTQPGVLLDRVIAVSDLACLPAGSGQNCDVPPDVTPPTVPSDFRVTAPPYGQAVLSWNASSDAIGVTGYQLYRNGEALAQTATGTTFTDTTVAMNQTYSYQVAAFDESGNLSDRTTSLSVRTPLKGDTEKPSKPLNLMPVYITASEIRLTWGASTDNNGVAGYEVWRSVGASAFAKVATAPDAQYRDTAVTPGVNYVYYVKAVDLGGNVSLQSASNNATTHGAKLATTLIGYVRNAVGQGVAGATVQVVISDTQTVTLTTNALGYYELNGLPGGSYSLLYSAPGLSSVVSLRNLGENVRIANNVTLLGL